jgi:hypothetical protein
MLSGIRHIARSLGTGKPRFPESVHPPHPLLGPLLTTLVIFDSTGRTRNTNVHTYIAIMSDYAIDYDLPPILRVD